MKKVNGFTLIKVGLSLSLIIPGFVRAEDYSLPALQADTAAVGSLVRPTISSAASDNTLDRVDAVLQDIQKKAEQSKKETDLRGKVSSWVKKNNAIDGIGAQLKGLEQKAIKDRGVDLKQAESLAAQVSQTQSLANPSDFNTSNLPKACSKGVDLQQFKGLMDMMQSQAGQRLSSQASSMLSDKIKENEAQQQQKLITMMAEFKELASRDEVDEEKLVSDTIKGARGVDIRVKELETDKLPSLKAKNKEKKSELVDGLFKFMSTMSAVGKNDKEVVKLGNDFANSIENSRQQALQMGMDSVDRLLSNCKSQVKAVYSEIEKTRRSLEPVVGVDAANLDAQAQIARANNLQCTDVADNVQAMLSGVNSNSQTGGIDLNSTLTQIRSEKNPTKLMVKAVEAMQAIAGIQAQIGQQIRPLMDDCTDAAQGLEALKQRGQQVSQQQRSTTGSVARTSSASRSGNFWNNSSTHSSTSSRTR